MAIGGVRQTGKFGNTTGNQGHAAEKSGGEAFDVEKHAAGSSEETKGAELTRYNKKSKVSKIVDKNKKNRRGSPRTVLVDGEIYEVFLLAIA